LNWHEPFAAGDWLALVVNIVFAGAMLAGSLFIARRTTAGDLQ
jgi:hypothetical protein